MFEAAKQFLSKLRVKEEAEFEGKVFHRYHVKEGITANKTLDAEDCGKLLLVQADAKTITLPATVVGYHYWIMNDMDDGDCLVTIDPNGSDNIEGIDYTGADGGAMTNTKATAIRGDYVKLIGDGADGWFVTECRGTWVIAES